MSYENLTCDIEGDGSIAVVRLNRPQRRNALSLSLMRELIDCLDGIGRDQAIRAVVLGAHGKVFSSGHDLAELIGHEVAEYQQLFDVCTVLMTTVQSIRQPVVAEVQGVATAAGCQLVATCDLALASTEAWFATPGVKIGLFCTTPMVALSRAIGRKRALEMLLTGREVDAATAVEWGLVNAAVPPDTLRAKSLALATSIARASPLTTGIGKQAFYTQIDLEQSKAYAYASQVMSTNATCLDAQEGISAFLEKRPARWVGK